ncbi:hypothetical protein GDO81_024299, partial [Engystomops pustulosus]
MGLGWVAVAGTLEPWSGSLGARGAPWRLGQTRSTLVCPLEGALPGAEVTPQATKCKPSLELETRPHLVVGPGEEHAHGSKSSAGAATQ